MRLDPLQQYAKLHRQLTEEKSQLENRLRQINQVLGGESTPAQFPQSSVPAAAPVQPAKRRGRKPKAANQMSMREAVLKALSHGPLARKELVGAVEATGYKFTTNNPLNSIGSVLYAKNGPIKSKLGKFYLAGGTAAVETSTSNNEESRTKKKRRKVSAAGRARIAAARKAWWARKKAGK